MSDQPNDEQSEAVVQTETRRPWQKRRRRELSVPMVAEMLAARLGIQDEAERERVLLVVWDLGRTQAQALCAQVAESTSVPDLTRAEAFFALAEQGEKKQRPAHLQPPPLIGMHAAEVVDLLAEQLDEHDPGPRLGLYRSVRYLGEQTALALLQQTHEIEAAGGLMLSNGLRRRTPGGVYFYLVRQAATPEQALKIFPPPKRHHKKTQPVDSRPAAALPTPESPRPQPAELPRLTWGEREHFFNGIDQQGEAKTVKMTLIGRPGTLSEQGACVAFVMQQAPKIPPLPAGLPLPPVEQVQATRYQVYVAAKQWKKVAEAIASPEDALIIEGFPVLDAERGTIAVFASNITTKALQAASRSSKA